MGRQIDPLHPTSDSWVLDSTNLSIREVVSLIADKAQLMIKEKTK